MTMVSTVISLSKQPAINTVVFLSTLSFSTTSFPPFRPNYRDTRKKNEKGKRPFNEFKSLTFSIPLPPSPNKKNKKGDFRLTEGENYTLKKYVQ